MQLDDCSALIVDDESVIVSMLSKQLVSVGVEAIALSSFGAVCDYMRENTDYKPSLLITDWYLKDGTGGAVAKAVRSRSPTTAVVLISGDSILPTLLF